MVDFIGDDVPILVLLVFGRSFSPPVTLGVVFLVFIHHCLLGFSLLLSNILFFIANWVFDLEGVPPVDR